MRRAAALVLRALPTGGLRPQQRPSPASTAAAAARAFGTWPGAPCFGAPPPRLARPGEYLTGVAHSTQWRVGHRFTVHVEYDTKDVDHFLELADALEEALPDVQVEGNVPGVHPRPGAFEVTTEDGRAIFSRLGARHFPARPDLVDRVRRLLPVKPAPGFGFSWR